MTEASPGAGASHQDEDSTLPTPHEEPSETALVGGTLIDEIATAPSTPVSDQLKPASTSAALENATPDLTDFASICPGQNDASDSSGSPEFLTQTEPVVGTPKAIVFTQPRSPSPEPSPASKQPRITDLWGNVDMADVVFSSFSNYNSSSSSSSSSSSNINSRDNSNSRGNVGKGGLDRGSRGKGKSARKSAKPAGKSAQRKLHQGSLARGDKKASGGSKLPCTTRDLGSLARQLAASPDPPPNLVTGSSAKKTARVPYETVLGGATDQHDTPQPRRTRSSTRTHGVAPPPPPSF